MQASLKLGARCKSDIPIPPIRGIRIERIKILWLLMTRLQETSQPRYEQPRWLSLRLSQSKSLRLQEPIMAPALKLELLLTFCLD